MAEELRDENFLGAPDEILKKFPKMPFGPEALDEVDAQKLKEKKEVSEFTKKLKESVKKGVSVEKLVNQVVTAALEVEFGKEFMASPKNQKIIKAIARMIQADEELLERTVAVALKSFLEKNKEIN